MKDLKKFNGLTILLVEDEPDLRRETAAFLELYCRRVIPAANGREAVDLFGQHQPDIVISDIRMPVMDGIVLTEHLKRTSPGTPVILCTAYTETAYLLKAIELGIAAFVRKPVHAEDLLDAVNKCALPLIQRQEIENLSSELNASVTELLGGTPALQTIADMTARVARTSFNILLQGETGTGKSRLAGIIHNLSTRRESPFIKVHMGAIPEPLAESELFGHLRGAFTGADKMRSGLMEAAQGGTVFLDDVESCPIGLQVKLLHFVEDKRFTPVGSNRETESDVRIIAASNRDLKEEVAKGQFREDLFYRLADYTITLPPLRETPDIIVPLALSFLRTTCDELDRDVPAMDTAAREALTRAAWPGNIRQLKSVIRRATLNADKAITADIFASVMDTPARKPARRATDEHPPVIPPPFPCSMDQLEKWSLEQALRFCGGKRMKAAAMLGMNYNTFRRRLEKHGLAKE
ncbi:MAG: sigma-54 dependent transcriptional regulator [Thermodesulfobacteriota bacterium]